MIHCRKTNNDYIEFMILEFFNGHKVCQQGSQLRLDLLSLLDFRLITVVHVKYSMLQPTCPYGACILNTLCC